MKIYIGGDSWGCGEWYYFDPGRGETHITHNIIHLGLEQFLLDAGHTVTNSSKASGGNVQIYEKILMSEEHDIYIIFQTEFMRDNDEWHTLSTWENIITRNKELQTTFYKNLGSLAPKKIYLLGGMEKIYKDQITQYSNLVTLIESIPEWLTNGDYISTKLDGLPGLPRNLMLPRDVDLSVLDKLIEFNDYWKDNITMNQQYFQPDGEHPNKSGHYRIYQELKLQQIIN